MNMTPSRVKMAGYVLQANFIESLLSSSDLRWPVPSAVNWLAALGIFLEFEYLSRATTECGPWRRLLHLRLA